MTVTEREREREREREKERLTHIHNIVIYTCLNARFKDDSLELLLELGNFLVL